jgi:XTP/dITP diphosphohydrolase
MKELLVATRNLGKMGEFRKFLSDIPIKIFSLEDLGITDEVEEDGQSYEENARKKATFFAEKSGFVTIADDSGIEIDALNGQPGKHSRRWLGYTMTDEEIIEHLKKISQEIPDDNRGAHFSAVLCMATPDGQTFVTTGRVDGIITKEYSLKRSPGYPFRSFFYLPKIDKFFFEDELSEQEQDLHNHRYIAVQKLKPILIKHFGKR